MARTPSARAHRSLASAIDSVLYERGLHEGTLDEICARAGVSKPALYRHFGDRDRILVDYARRRRERRVEEMTAAADAAGSSARSRAFALVDWIADWVSSSEFQGCVFHRALQQRPQTLPDLAAIVTGHKAWVEAKLRDEVAAIVDDPDGVASHVFMLAEGALAAGAYRDRAVVARRFAALAYGVIDAAARPV